MRKDPMHLSDEIVSEFGLPSNEITVDYIETVLKLDTEQLRVAPGLSAIHTSSGHFTKMKVGIAVQFFCEAPAAISYFIGIGKLPVEAKTTAWLFDLIFRSYTLMTSRHPVVA